MTDLPTETFAPDWLALREPADAAARSGDLADRAARVVAERAAGRSPGLPLVVHDLGCGSGSMGRWLAPLLPAPQRWVLHDHDPALLALAAAHPGVGPDGAPVGVEGRRTALAALSAGDLAGADLVTASALLDVLTADEVRGVVAAVAGACVPALLTLSVVGRVVLDPPDPRDVAVRRAFDEHQRRVVGGRALLGPDALDVARATFEAHGWTVEVRPSPWRLGPGDLIAAWLDGWLGAAAEQDPDAVPAAYAQARREAAAARTLRADVHHGDLLAVPPG